MNTITRDLPAHPASEQKVMVARQPIYNVQMGVFGYELLFRSTDSNSKGFNPTQATAQVLASTVLNFGLDELVLNRKAVINVTRVFLDVISDIPLPPDRIVLDIPDNIAIDSTLVTRLEELRSMGYGLSVGGLANLKRLQPILPLADIFRIDVHKVNVNLLDALIKFLRRHDNLALQALKIETMEEYRFYCDKGFNYLQGYFLGRPRKYVSGDLPANKLAILHLLALVHSMSTETQELEQEITRDVSLSYKLLKLINAPFFGVAREVDSIKQAIVLLGRNEIRNWVSLLALGGLNDQPIATLEIAFLRAKLCELLAEKAGLPKDSYFTVGMFSALDMLMKQPIESILAKLPLSEEVKTAILEKQGMLGNALSCALAIENADWADIDFANLNQEDLSGVYRKAIQWSGNVMMRI